MSRSRVPELGEGVELYVEFMLAKGSNSGVYLHGLYEVQVFDSYASTEPMTSSDCGGIYHRWINEQGVGGSAPSRNASRRPGPNTAPSAAASIGSPSGVPVPWASTYATSAGAMPASAHAAASKARCPAGFGAVMPLVRPSWLIAPPRITA